MSLKESSMAEHSEGTLCPRGVCGSFLTDFRKKETSIAGVYSQAVSDEVAEGILGRNVVLEGCGGVNEEEGYLVEVHLLYRWDLCHW